MENQFVRLDGKIVCEVFVNTTQMPITELFHADVASKFEPCSIDGVEVGWIKRQDGTFSPPPPPAIETIPTTQV